MKTKKIFNLVNDSIKALDSILENKVPPNIPRESYINTTIKHVRIQLNRVKENLDQLDITNIFTVRGQDKITVDELAKKLNVTVRTIQRHCEKLGIGKIKGEYKLTAGQADEVIQKCKKSPGRPPLQNQSLFYKEKEKIIKAMCPYCKQAVKVNLRGELFKKHYKPGAKKKTLNTVCRGSGCEVYPEEYV